MMSSSSTAALPPRPQEQLLIDLLGEWPEGRMLANTVGRGQFALAYAAQHASARVACWSLDLYQHEQAMAAAGELPTVQFVCSADLPAHEQDIVALMFSKQGDGELARELLQQAILQLRDGGWLLVTTDNPEDTWLAEQMKRLPVKVKRRPFATGVVYQALKTGPLKKLKRYQAEFVFRDRHQLLELTTRPGVFSHREVDPGARALLRSMFVDPEQRILDIGCGSGVVALAAATRETTTQVYAIDANARAVECTALSAANNQVANLRVALDCDGRTVDKARFDLALANPPYFSNFRIAELFVRIAAQGLRPGGKLLLVTKTPQWYVDHLNELGFGWVDVEVAKNYLIVHAERSEV